MTEKIFPLERILTVSASDYIDTKNKTLLSYDMMGVHVEILKGQASIRSLINEFATKIPKGTEVVVNYNVVASIAHSSDPYISASGTALILRKSANDPK